MRSQGLTRRRRLRSWIGLASVALLLALGAPTVGTAQNPSANESVQVAIPGLDTTQDTAARRSASGADLPRKQRKVSQPIGELRPVVEWQWGAVLAAVLAMVGAIVLTLPIAMAYRWTKPAGEYDPGVMHSSIILAPTIAGLLIVIQGSLAMAFSLAGVATAVRFRNSLKDTNDAVYVFVAVAIGLAAGVQALDIALAISLIFTVTVVLLSRSPFRHSGGTHAPEHGHHHHQPHEGVDSSTGAGAGLRADGQREPKLNAITIRAADQAAARAAVEPVLDAETKWWALERSTPDASGAVALVYTIRCRKRTPYGRLVAELRAAAGSQSYGVEDDASAPGLASAQQRDRSAAEGAPSS
jgi:hypothetical protein